MPGTDLEGRSEGRYGEGTVGMRVSGGRSSVRRQARPWGHLAWGPVARTDWAAFPDSDPIPAPPGMSRTARRPAGPDAPSVNPVFPLLLLETMRDMDRPDEVLEGEDLSASMPRRLGLSDVVYLQIHKFREETRKKRPQTPAIVADLIRLVIRRPDADEIFEQAGRRVARHAWEQKAATSRRALRLMPSGMRLRAAARNARRLLGELAGNAQLEVVVRPFQARLRGSLTAQADPGGPACTFYTGLLAELMTEYTGRRHTAQHPRCEARGGPCCEWVTFVAS